MTAPIPRRPRALRAGDVVGIAAPASPVREPLLAAGEAYLRGLGFAVRRAPNVLARARYTAGSVRERADDLNHLLADPAVRAVLVARGGYGSAQLIPHLDRDALRRDPKVLMGASDATALLLWALGAGVAVMHGPMPAREMQEGRVDAGEFLRHLTEAHPFGPLAAPGARALHPGHASGRLVGGCLSLVVASLGTAWEIETGGRLLFLEDADTKPYQVDRMLTQLAQAGKLGSAVGVAFGEMPGCIQHPDQGYHLDEVLRDLTAGLGIPVAAGLPCGHTREVHRLLPIGIEATLETSAEAVHLRFTEPFVS